MPKYLFGICFILFGLLGCKKEGTAKSNELNPAVMKVRILKTDHSIVKLNGNSESIVSNWTEYQNYKEAVEPYQAISLSDALLNSEELAILAQQLKDSIRIEKIDTPSVRIRLNVIHSESLRLFDMSKIPTITEGEVVEANNDVINAFSALNLKLNNMIRKENINNDISRFIDEVVNENDSIQSDADNSQLSEQKDSVR